jgi:hypothetical protein
MKLKARDDPATCAILENENALLDDPDEETDYSYLPDLNHGCSHSGFMRSSYS